MHRVRAPWGANTLIEIGKFTILAFLIVTPFRLFVAQPFIVSGASMVPTFDEDEYLVVDQITYRFEKPERGDIIVFRYPLDPSHFFIKRIIGLPGETVEIKDGMVFVHEAGGDTRHALVEPYLASHYKKKDARPTVLEAGEYYVLGDNRDQSADSRVWGQLSERFIIGRALVRLYPFGETDFLPGEYHYPHSE